MTSEQNVLTRFPNLAEALEELVDEYGLDLVCTAVDELCEEIENG